MRFKVRSFPVGFLVPTVNPEQLAGVINEAVRGGYRFKREEVSIEPRRALLFLSALALNIVFKWEPDEPPFEYKIFTYRTRLFTQTVDVPKMTWELNRAAQGGFEVYFGFKQMTRWMLLFPRETYFFVLRRRADGQNYERTYRFVEYAYRFFSGTMDPAAYEAVLNAQGGQSRHVVSFRDERRVFGSFRQSVAITLFEDPLGASMGQYPQPGYGYPQQQGYPSGYPDPAYPQHYAA